MGVAPGDLKHPTTARTLFIRDAPSPSLAEATDAYGRTHRRRAIMSTCLLGVYQLVYMHQPRVNITFRRRNTLPAGASKVSAAA